jgi:CBS domain containing-hemolysin-like protein
MTLLILYLLLALGVSFLCSILEAVLLSINAPYIAALIRDERPGGQRLAKLKANVDRPLAAILSLNTIAHTVGAAGVGAQAAHLFGDDTVGIASAVLTVLILVLSEIIPKTLGASHWRGLAPAVARVMGPLIVLMWPLVQLSRGISRLLRSGGESPISREEVSAMAELGARQGVIAESETHILRNLFRFDSLAVEHIMTPRTVLFSLPEVQTVGEVLAQHPQSPFSRIPVYSGSRDEVTGYVMRDDILLRAANNEQDLPLSKLRRPIKVVPVTTELPRLFDAMLEERIHIALAVDRFGGTAGVVTMEDVLETLIGMEIVDEVDHVDDMQELARRHWERRARKRGLIPLNTAAEAAAPEAAAEAAAPEATPDGKGER